MWIRIESWVFQWLGRYEQVSSMGITYNLGIKVRDGTLSLMLEKRRPGKIIIHL